MKYDRHQTLIESFVQKIRKTVEKIFASLIKNSKPVDIKTEEVNYDSQDAFHNKNLNTEVHIVLTVLLS